MGSILGALSRANATLGSAAGAKLAVWECVKLSHGLSASLNLSVFLTDNFSSSRNTNHTKDETGGGRGVEERGREREEGGIVISQQCQKSQQRPCLSIEASLGRTMDFPAI